MSHAPTMAVPKTYEEFLDPAWLHAALDDIGEDDKIVSIERTGISKTRAEKLRFAVTVDGPKGPRVNNYCVKAHLDGSAPGSITEAQFYIDLAPRLDMRIPKVHYAALDGQDWIFVMEDVEASGATCMSALTPLPVDVAYTTLAQLARLHGSTWGLTSVADIGWLGNGPVGFAGRGDAEVLQKLLDDGRAIGFPPELCSGANLAAAMQKHAEFGETCVLHGDTHTGNVYVDAEGRGCWFDWEVVQTGHWAQDVSYHLSAALSIEDRRANERDLLRHYLSELAAQGAPAPAFDDAWDLYRRSFSYGYLLWVITMIRSRNEVLAHMPRIATAMADHETFRLLGVI